MHKLVKEYLCVCKMEAWRSLRNHKKRSLRAIKRRGKKEREKDFVALESSRKKRSYIRLRKDYV